MLPEPVVLRCLHVPKVLEVACACTQVHQVMERDIMRHWNRTDTTAAVVADLAEKDPSKEVHCTSCCGVAKALAMVSMLGKVLLAVVVDSTDGTAGHNLPHHTVLDHPSLGRLASKRSRNFHHRVRELADDVVFPSWKQLLLLAFPSRDVPGTPLRTSAPCCNPTLCNTPSQRLDQVSHRVFFRCQVQAPLGKPVARDIFLLLLAVDLGKNLNRTSNPTPDWVSFCTALERGAGEGSDVAPSEPLKVLVMKRDSLHFPVGCCGLCLVPLDVALGWEEYDLDSASSMEVDA